MVVYVVLIQLFDCVIMQENRYSGGFSTRSHTNRPVQSQKSTRTLRFHILEEEKIFTILVAKSTANS